MSLAETLDWTPADPPRLTAPRPKPPAADLPLLRLITTMRASNIAAWPARAYREMLLHRRFFGVDCYLVNDPQAARRFLAQEARFYERPVGIRRLLRPMAGAGLLLAEGEDWRKQRRMLAPAFTPKSVDTLVPRLQEGASVMVAGLGDGGRMNLAAVLEHATIDVVGRAFFSMPLARYADRISSIRAAYFGDAARPSPLDFFARREADFTMAMGRRAGLGRACLAVIDEILAERRLAHRADGQSADMIDLLLAARDPETGLPLTTLEVRDQAVTLLATGFVSTALVMFWTAYLLSRDPAEQARVRAEIARYPARRLECMADLDNWPSLMRAINEAMRLYPPVPALARVACEPTQILGTPIAAGSLVNVSTWVIHRHHSHWTSPELFIPERFAEGPHRHPAFMPFGVGPRICIGGALATTEAAILLAHLLDRFTVKLDDPRPVTPIAVTVTAPSIEPLFRLEAG